MEQTRAGAPTGCYKCGRAGHWARDCTLAATASSSSANARTGHRENSRTADPPPKAKRLLKPRRKLDENLLLSKEGLGYVLEHIPRMVHIKGPSHEIDDLRSLLEAYIHWHSLFMPSVSFEHFLRRLEKLGSTRRVRRCLRELRDRVARGENPKTLHEPPVDDQAPAEEEVMDAVESVPHHEEETHHEEENADFEIQEDLFDELYREATGKDSGARNNVADSVVQTSTQPQEENADIGKTDANNVNENSESNTTSDMPSTLTQEQRARIAANRLRALEKAAARSALKNQRS